MVGSSTLVSLPPIHELLAQRHPFLFIDRIRRYERGLLVAEKFIGENEGYFKGHFPDYPLVPGVLLLEMMAQASAALATLDRRGDATVRPRPGRFVAIRRARFLREVHPATSLEIKVGVIQRLGALACFEAGVTSSGLLVADAALILATGPG